VLGLGNGGARYRDTRHNVGFRVVDCLALRRGLDWGREGDLERRVSVARWAAAEAGPWLARSEGSMNRSGAVAAALCRALGCTPAALIAVYDDVDLALGRLRLRRRGGPGGHNGVRSLIEWLGTEEFPRIRLGVSGAGREGRDLADYVLEPFERDETAAVERLVRLAADAVELALEGDFEQAMNRYNGSDAAAVTGAAERGNGRDDG